MEQPTFRAVAGEDGEGITYECGCACVPVAAPAADGSQGFEHCCCGKVHFVGADASGALSSYLAERRESRKREPSHCVGSGSAKLADKDVEVAWAFPE